MHGQRNIKLGIVLTFCVTIALEICSFFLRENAEHNLVSYAKLYLVSGSVTKSNRSFGVRNVQFLSLKFMNK